MKNTLLILLLALAGNTIAQSGYWQQHVAYTMAIDFNHETHQFTGTQKLVYTNNSPDVLHKVYYHLFYNAFQPESMLAQRVESIEDPDKRMLGKLIDIPKSDIGYQNISTLSQDGIPLTFEVYGTVLKAELRQPLQPGESTVLEMTFDAQVPIMIRRTGRNNSEDIDYTMTQWYPKLAEYDVDGWHPDAYVAREFYAPFGSFDVTINIDKKYTLAGTGNLQNAEDLGYGYFDGKVKKQKSKVRTWHFTADNVHDFAWAADDDYIHESVQVPDGPRVHLFYSKKTANIKNWERLPEYVVKYFTFMADKFGKYPYEQFSLIQAGDGGMEYPNCTMMMGGGESFGGLLGLFAHEATHNWYYGILGSNETRYPFMDEGFTSFAEEEFMNEFYAEEKEVNAHLSAYNNYFYLLDLNDSIPGYHEPMNLSADYFEHNKMHTMAAYYLGELYVNQVKYMVGDDAFWKGMKTYFETWKFKHPRPSDFIRIMEIEADMELDWFEQTWLNTTRKIDYGIEEVISTGKENSVVLKNYSNFPMPVDVYILFTDGEFMRYTIPLQMQFGYKPDFAAVKAWPWTQETYKLQLPIPLDKIEGIYIDPFRMMADSNLENNSWEK